MLSTMLYSACTIIENMAGSAMEKIRGSTGIVPILFSSNTITLLSCWKRGRSPGQESQIPFSNIAFL